MTGICDSCKEDKVIKWRGHGKGYLCDPCYIQEYPFAPKEVILKSPIGTGMALAFGFFLMGIVLAILGWVFVGASCAAFMSGF